VWKYQDKEFTSDDIPEGVIGFVYIITDTDTNKKYIGKKLLKSKRKLPPLKGKKRRRHVIKETDWQKYYSSSEEIKSLVEEHGGERFDRKILYLCKSKGEMTYREMREQIDRQVLFRDDYMNGIIQVRIHKSHVNGIDP